MVGLYLKPPENALVLCAIEKSQVQALECTQPLLPMGSDTWKESRLHPPRHYDALCRVGHRQRAGLYPMQIPASAPGIPELSARHPSERSAAAEMAFVAAPPAPAHDHCPHGSARVILRALSG